MKRLLFFCMLFFVPALYIRAQVIQPLSKTETVGFSPERLQQLTRTLQQWVNEGRMPGGEVLILRKGKTVYHQVVGFADVANKKPLAPNQIYRIASQTKAITSVAIMMLFEEGKLLLDDPVGKYIPAFQNQTVLQTFNAADTTYTTVPARRPVTIRHLLTHTSGIGYAAIGSPEANAIYAKHRLTPGLGIQDDNLLDAMNRLAALPLMHQPGEKFTYGLNTDLLGCLVEVISGQTLDEFFRKRIFEPLGMNDTYFTVPQAKAGRMVVLHREEEEGKFVRATSQMLNQKEVSPDYPLQPTTYFSGGAGLSSTIKDYGIFLQMLLNGGVYNGKRILSRNSVRMMTMNQIGDLNVGPDKFGLGFRVVTESSSARMPYRPGTYSWGGAFNTSYWVDPKEEMVILFYRQLQHTRHPDLPDRLLALVYAALVD